MKRDYTEDELKKFVPLEVDGISPNMYEINMLGEIKNKRFNKIIKGTIIPDGYHTVVLKKDVPNQTAKRLRTSTQFKTHRLVAKTFLPNPNNLPVVDHIDRNKLNNSVLNLRWASYSENVKNSTPPKEKSNFIFYQKIDDNGNILETISVRDLKKRGYNPTTVSIAYNNNRKYQNFYWKRYDKKLENYLKKYNIDLSKEEWKIWTDGEFKVECSKNGLFKNPKITVGGEGTRYYRITLSNGKKRKGYSCHRIIYECWSGEKLTKNDAIDHISTDPHDNRFCNLRKGTLEDNQNNPNTLAKRGRKVYRYSIYGEFLGSYNSIVEISRSDAVRVGVGFCCRKINYVCNNEFWCYAGEQQLIVENINNGIYRYKDKNDKTPINQTVKGMSWNSAGKFVKNCILTGQPHPKTGYYYSLGLKNWETGEQIIPDVTPKLEEENKK